MNGITASRIKAARTRLGLSPADLASEVGVSERSVARWEKGNGPKSKAIKTALLAVLNRGK